MENGFGIPSEFLINRAGSICLGCVVGPFLKKKMAKSPK
jgi:hypothetical protein